MWSTTSKVLSGLLLVGEIRSSQLLLISQQKKQILCRMILLANPTFSQIIDKRRPSHNHVLRLRNR
ncbi:hypothetical protein M758_UG087200 [Ceratodon purpureus]|nr:hypothetical protein M758_UG087200 [Ceratodon purpureus]